MTQRVDDIEKSVQSLNVISSNIASQQKELTSFNTQLLISQEQMSSLQGKLKKIEDSTTSLPTDFHETIATINKGNTKSTNVQSLTDIIFK
jgi:hypothetical protein